MAKRVHNEPTANSSRNTLIVMAVGGLLVAALVGWAITRSVEPAVPNDTSTAAGLSETTANATMPPADPLSATNPAANPSTNTMPPLSELPPITTTSGIPAHEDPERASIARIAAEDLRSKYNRGDVTVIDVRDAGSYAAGHIAGAIHIPLARIEGEIPYLPKGKAIVTYCTWPAEESSAGAALIMKRHGINDVSALAGGLDAWRNVGYPTKTGEQP